MVASRSTLYREDCSSRVRVTRWKIINIVFSFFILLICIYQIFLYSLPYFSLFSLWRSVFYLSFFHFLISFVLTSFLVSAEPENIVTSDLSAYSLVSLSCISGFHTQFRETLKARRQLLGFPQAYFLYKAIGNNHFDKF